MMWTWELCSASGTTIAGLELATGRTITRKRNTYTEAACTIHHDDPAAFALIAAINSREMPCLKAWRRTPGATASTLRFYGQMVWLKETLEETATLALTFRSPFARLLGDGSKRGRRTGPQIAASQKDAGQIAASLVRLYGGRADGGTGGADPNFTDTIAGVTYQETSYIGLDVGNIQPTVLRDRTYQSMNVGQAIVNLSNVLDGFDFDERFVDGEGDTMAYLDIFAHQGAEQLDAKFEYGPDTLRNIRSVERTIEPPIDYVQLTGGNGLIAVAEAGVGHTPDGFYSDSFTDILEQSTLNDRAQALLRPNPIQTVTWVPEPALAPSPWDDFDLGDTVLVYGRRDAFMVETPQRINSYTVVIDDDGNEAAAIPDPLDPDGERVLQASLTTEVVPT